LKDGSVVVVGRADTIAGRGWGWAARISQDGTLLWERDWSSLGKSSALFAATAVADGGVVAVGEIVSPESAGTHYNVGLVMKIDERGAIEWTGTLDLGAITQITAVTHDGSGGAVIGAVMNKGGPPSSFIARVTASGKITPPIPLDDHSSGLVLGIHRIGEQGYVAIDSALVWLDRDGRPLWRQAGSFRDAAVFRDGSVVAVRFDRAQITRFSPGGARLWESVETGSTICVPVGVWTRGLEEIVVIGNACPGSEVASLAVFSANGEARGIRQVRVGPGVQAIAAVAGPSENVLLAGIAHEKEGWVFRSGPIQDPGK